MPRVETIELTCPNCGCRFTSATADQTNIKGRRRTDFHVHAEGTPLAYGVHVCERCGFAGRQDWFATSEVSFAVQCHVWGELAPRISEAAPTSSEKYEFAAKVAAWNGAVDREIGDLWLRAAWCCVEEEDVEAERYYRLRAAWTFEECLSDYDGVDRQERVALTYLVGELWRRIGDLERAKHWFQRVPDEAGNRPEDRWFVRWARQQQFEPGEWFE
jgi:uncharacterized protein (DUF2225 family)